MRGNWNQFGVIETIYEEEHEFSSSSSLSLSPSFSSSPPSLHSLVNAWTQDSGYEADVWIRVQGTSFHLHKDRMVSRSSYLKRQLTAVSNFTLSPPLNITPGTFAAIAEFCYNRKVQLTPTNVAAIRTAAELLGMTEEENLCHVTESYFQRIVGSDGASVVLRSCLSLLPEAETMASLVSRCIESLIWAEEVEVSWLEVVMAMEARDFQTVAHSLNRRLPNHDVLYKIVDLYLKENKHCGKLTEEQETQICNSIDCTQLSPHTLVDCVRNPTMPLRFIVQAMLLENLNTHRSVAVATAAATTQQPERPSLGDFLNHDTAQRQTAQLKEAMDSTYTRIQRLEKELKGMKKILQQHQAEEEEEEEQKQRKNNVLDSERSASFHLVREENSRIIQRGGRGSVSSSGFFLGNNATKRNEVEKYNFSKSSNDDDGCGTPKITRSFRHRFITGLKNAFRISNSASKGS